MRRTLHGFAFCALAAATLAAAPSEEALELRNLGLAELENEQPGNAEELFRRLVAMVPDDPLPAANLAIAALRQQKFEEASEWVGRALAKSPGDPRLLAIEAEIHLWSGQPQQALAVYRQAAAGAPRDPEIQYALLRQAANFPGDEATVAAGEALGRLMKLRPDNLVVMLQVGQQAVAAGDRAAATAAYLRIRELLWQAPGPAERLLEEILGKLEAGEPAAARVPAQRLENVLKVTPMFRETQRELATGIQGVPLVRFRDEPEPVVFGEPLEVRFRGARLAEGPAAAPVAADFDGDRRTDLAWLAGGQLVVRLATAGGGPPARLPAAGIAGLLAADLDNDGKLDLVGWGTERFELWKGDGAGGFTAASDSGLAGGAAAAAVIDFDIEGDLDLAAVGGKRGLELYRNALAGPLEAVGERTLPRPAPEDGTALIVSDLDRDGDLDLLVAHRGGLAWLDNLRQGTFVDRTHESGLAAAGAARAMASADLDNDGLPDLVTAGRGVKLYRNLGGRFGPWALGDKLRTSAEFSSVETFDADNDGRLDLAVGGPGGLAVLARRQGRFEFLPLEEAPSRVAAVLAADLDQDCDLDLVTAGPEGVHRLENLGGDANRCLQVRLQGLDKGSSKNNFFGLGATLELRAGRAYQFREATGDVTHFGIGRFAEVDLLRVVWTNGVPQNRLAPGAEPRIVEEQLLKGSCPFLYAWDGERVRFVTDLLWGAPAGLPVAPGVWAGADPSELVRVDGAAPRGGVWDLRITEELWEAAYFDLVRLWVVDHPEDVEVASSLKVVPGAQVPDRVHGTRGLRPVAAAVDAAGNDATARVAARDEIYADGWRASAYQGVAAKPWSFTFDLGEAPAGPVRLHLDGWIFPADASLNLAVAQRQGGPAPLPPRLEVETAAGWRTLLPSMGFPAGKTKTMVVDTPPLPAGARRLRIVSGQWLSWDRVAWSERPADAEPVVRTRLAPARADLAYRGFSAPVRESPNGPHLFDYARITSESPWLPFPGHYTRYGDVRELLATADDRSVILGPGDELRLAFDGAGLEPPPPGWRRTVFLESHGWDKDADRNTWEAKQLEPLPFRAMSGYPYGPGESYPDTPLHRRYREEWLTRVVTGTGSIRPTAAAADTDGAAASEPADGSVRAGPAGATTRR